MKVPSTTERRVVTLGTRGSKLALAQTALVRDALLAHHPGLTVEIARITTRGDVLLDRPLAALGDRGLFVAEIEAALRAGRIDLAVHSAKDLPSGLPDDVCLGALLPRADARDVLVSRAGGVRALPPSARVGTSSPRRACQLRALPPGARVGTSSPRRACQLRALRPDLVIRDVRGNVDTRLRKLEAGEYDALVLAAAGLVRLDLAHLVTEWLAPDLMLPAVGQGALAVESRADDQALAVLLAPLDDPATRVAVTAERSFLAVLGAGCAAAVGAYATVVGTTLTLTGLIGAPDGRLVRGVRTGTIDGADDLGAALGAALLAQGGDLLAQAAGGAGATDD